MGEQRVLLIGAGGLGCPAALALVGAGIRHLGVADDDEVEITNLHRQIVYEEADVGRPKVEAFASRMRVRAPVAVTAHRTRLLPENARDIISGYDVVLEGADNYATKFLCADACYLAGVPVVHASAVRWSGFAFSAGRDGGPCYRCVFEDIPEGPAATCEGAGVMGAVVGVIGALQADLALGLLSGEAGGALVTFEGKGGTHRRVQTRGRKDCPLCGAKTIRTIDRASYR